MPLGEYPYLWMSAEIEVTPSTEKFHAGTGSPISSQNGSSQPPRQASTWHNVSLTSATCARSVIGSITP